MKNLCNEFQGTVQKCLVRHHSVLDVTSKLQESCARANRAFAKSVTTCGCIRVVAERQTMPDNIKLSEAKMFMRSHVEGTPCENCREALENELGSTLVYVAAMCNILDLDLQKVIQREHEKLTALGVYSLA